MSFIIGLLTVFLVINCLFLILLVLVQLPKKESGMGTAFGGAAADALFGAGTGTALSKITKYAATIFLSLVVVLAVLQSRRSESKDVIGETLSKEASATPPEPLRTAPTNTQRLLNVTPTNQPPAGTPQPGVENPPKTPEAAPQTPVQNPAPPKP